MKIKQFLLLFSLALASTATSQADILIGWHTPDVNGTSAVNDSTPDTSATGVTGTISGGRDVETTDGSTDGSYGTFAIPGNPTTANRIRVKTNGADNVVTISITNGTGSDVQLGSVLFDYGRFTNGPATATVKYASGDLADANDTAIGSDITLSDTGGLNGDLPDYAADIQAALTDSTLADTESATFTITFTNAVSGTNNGGLDNIAISDYTPPVIPPAVAFDDHATGAATDASLNAVTTAGTWTLNTSRTDTTFTVKNDNGNKALEFDDTSSPGDNAGEQEFATLTFPDALSFASEPVVFKFNVAPRRDAADRGYVFVFKDSLGNEAGRIEWASDIGGLVDGVYLNGTTAGGPGSGNQIGYLAMGGSLNPWVATNRLLSVVFDNGNVNPNPTNKKIWVNFDGVSGDDDVLNSAIDIKSIVVLSNGSDAGNRGLYIDDLNQPTPLVLGWNSGSATPDILTSGFTTDFQIVGSGNLDNTAHGSTDGSYGTFGDDAPATSGAIELFNNASIDFEITNNTGGMVLLEDIRLDFNRRDADAPTDVTVDYVSGDLDDAAIELGSLTGQAAIETDLADYNDLDLELRKKLFDAKLDDGESALFRITVSSASGSTASYIDNISVHGSLSSYITGATSPPSVSNVRKPNVVVFYADDLGIGDVSAYGYPSTDVSTPNIDTLASQGIRFTDAHTAFATCAPSRYGVLAGSMPFRGQRFNGTFRLEQSHQFKAGQKSTGHLFQEAGYRTAHIGKTHLGGGLIDDSDNEVNSTNLGTVDWLKGIWEGPTGYLGFDYSFISHDGVQGPQYIYHENDFPVTNFAYNDTTNTWTWSAATTQAYLFLQAGSPSNPVTGDIDLDPDSNSALSEILYNSEYVTGGNPTPEVAYGYGDFDTTKTGEIYMQAAKNFITDHVANHTADPFYLHFASQAVHIPHTPDVTYFDDTVKGAEKTKHLDMVREMDLQLRDLVAHLTAEGVIDETIIIFTSDNGGLQKSYDEVDQNGGPQVFHDGSGSFRGNKTTPWEGGSLVPFIVRWGDGTTAGSVIPPGIVCEQVVTQMDLFPTFATFLDLPQPTSQARDGVNILPYLLGQTTTPLRDHLIAGASYQNAYRFSYRLGGWKIITGGPKTNNNGDLLNHTVSEMYHYASDPYETIDLAGDPDYSEIQTRIYDSLIARVHGSTRSTSALDSDADGLFDDWENSVAGNLTAYDANLLTATTDSDGDGVQDKDEYAQRSNPTVADKINYQPTLNARSGSPFTVGWNSQSGLFYSIDQSSDLQTWTPLSGTVLGNGGPIEVEVPSVDPQSFYRIKVE